MSNRKQTIKDMIVTAEAIDLIENQEMIEDS